MSSKPKTRRHSSAYTNSGRKGAGDANPAAADHVAMARLLAYIPQTDIWPDNWAASPRRLRARTFQTISPKSLNRENGRDVRWSNPTCIPSAKGFSMTIGVVKFYN